MNAHGSAIPFEVAVDCRNLLGEGPIWDPGGRFLYWVDIKAPRVWRYAWPDGPPEHWEPPLRISAVAPRARGGLIAATERGFATVDFESGQVELVGDPEAHLPGNRFNDGKVDHEGRFWAGTMDDAEEQSSGSLYRLCAGLEWKQIDEGYRVTNGPAFSPDGAIVYHSDSALRRVYRYRTVPDGAVGPREKFLQFSEAEGSPDGMTTDADGCLWIAFWDGGCVRRLAPDGGELARIDLPVSRPTSCAFGGADLDRLFITSARVGLSHAALRDQPLAGALFVATPGVRGIEPVPFAG